MRLSVIIPTLNEEKTIHATLENLFIKQGPDEVLVVDGGSKDRTALIAGEWTDVLHAVRGRANQMNAGASHATGDILLFLHADTKLPDGGLSKIKQAILAGAKAGRFRMRFDERRFLLGLYESYTRFQCFSYGDQAFFMRREIFEALGGFRTEVPFEDIDFYRRLCRITQPVILKEQVITSARRFSSVGDLKQKFINLFLVALYYAGFNVLRFKQKFYRDTR